METTCTPGDIICPVCGFCRCQCDLKSTEYRDFKDNVISGALKNGVNILIWQYGNPNWTLAKAERAAIEIYDILVREDMT